MVMEDLLPCLEPHLIVVINNKKNYNLLSADSVPAAVLSTSLDQLR